MWSEASTGQLATICRAAGPALARVAPWASECCSENLQALLERVGWERHEKQGEPHFGRKELAGSGMAGKGAAGETPKLSPDRQG